MLGLQLIYKAITVLMTLKITKMALVNMYLTIGGVKIRVLGYTPEIFHCGPTQPCGASLSIHYHGIRRRQLY